MSGKILATKHLLRERIACETEGQETGFHNGGLDLCTSARALPAAARALVPWWYDKQRSQRWEIEG